MALRERCARRATGRTVAIAQLSGGGVGHAQVVYRLLLVVVAQQPRPLRCGPGGKPHRGDRRVSCLQLYPGRQSSPCSRHAVCDPGDRAGAEPLSLKGERSHHRGAEITRRQSFSLSSLFSAQPLRLCGEPFIPRPGRLAGYGDSSRVAAVSQHVGFPSLLAAAGAQRLCGGAAHPCWCVWGRLAGARGGCRHRRGAGDGVAVALSALFSDGAEPGRRTCAQPL